MPYRIDVPSAPQDAFDILVELGALDIEMAGAGLAAILPDSVTPADLRWTGLRVSAAVPRDDGSVWLVSPRAIRVGGVLIAPASDGAPLDALRLIDSGAFGTAHHPTTALCIERLAGLVGADCPSSVLDVGTGSGILALAALKMGVARAAGVDVDPKALEAAAENARINGLSGRFELRLGGPDRVDGVFPVVAANILPAPLIELAPLLVRRLGKGGRLILSGIHESLEADVRRAYRHLGIRVFDSETRGGWTALTAHAGW